VFYRLKAGAKLVSMAAYSYDAALQVREPPPGGRGGVPPSTSDSVERCQRRAVWKKRPAQPLARRQTSAVILGILLTAVMQGSAVALEGGSDSASAGGSTRLRDDRDRQVEGNRLSDERLCAVLDQVNAKFEAGRIAARQQRALARELCSARGLDAGQASSGPATPVCWPGQAA